MRERKLAYIYKLMLICYVCLLVSASSALEEHSLNDLTSIIFYEPDLDTWVPPEEFLTAFPYYLSGYDEECRPIWVGVLGKGDAKKIIEKGEKDKQILQKFLHQALFRLVSSIKAVPAYCTEPSQIVVIYDMDGFNYYQLTSITTASYFVNITQKYVPLAFEYAHSVYFLNANVMAKGLMQIARPILGALMERVEVFGTNRPKWLPMLLRKLPRSQLPGRFGGDKDFKPVKLYGMETF